MEPAVLFAGDISAYVLWAVTLDGTTENLGEVIADKKSSSGTLQGYTGKKVFALMVTAEPFATVTRPAELVVFVSGEVQGMNIDNTPFTFKDFTTDYKPALDSISGVQYNDPMPAAVKQASKAMEIAGKLNAAEVNPKAMDGARSPSARRWPPRTTRRPWPTRPGSPPSWPRRPSRTRSRPTKTRRPPKPRPRGWPRRRPSRRRATTAEGESPGSPRSSRRSRSSARPWPPRRGAWPS